ncbi:MAG TPA: hypothetical protein PLT08_01470, partial [Anaerolineales bacterium]|nr:hypothetical protein [Anaerolineales bacterium]
MCAFWVEAKEKWTKKVIHSYRMLGVCSFLTGSVFTVSASCGIDKRLQAKDNNVIKAKNIFE